MVKSIILLKKALIQFKVLHIPFVALSLTLLLTLSCNNQQQSNNANQDFSATSSNKNNSPNTESGPNSEPLTVVNWNIEWLGSTQNGPKDKNRQLENAIKILRYLKADLYCLCEIVDQGSLKKLSAALGKDYGYEISDYGSGAKSSRDPGYLTTQKLAFIYNKTRLKNISTTAYLAEDPRAGYYFASGRYPFELSATLQSGNTAQQIDFLIIHAKAGADKASYERRRQAARSLKAALDKEKSNAAFMLLGDFNDHMKGSITAGAPSPYQSFIEDPDYQVLTLPLYDQRSTLHYNGVIDQQIISNELERYYIPGSTKIRTDITVVVPDYKKGGTSDHYPISSQFKFQAGDGATSLNNKRGNSVIEKTSVTQQSEQVTNWDKDNRIITNIFTAKVAKDGILITSAIKSENIEFILLNKKHHKVLSVHRKYILQGDDFTIRTPDLYKGDYSLLIISDQGKQQIPFTIQ